jgi:hypothetical protein
MPKKTSYSTYHLHAKNDRKRKEAKERQANYDSLTIVEKITLATQRGGSKRELARLEKKQQVTTPTLPTVEPAKAPKAKKPAKVKKS